jgi:hypothetical protein
VEPSVIKPVVTTIHKKLVLSKREMLLNADLEVLKILLQRILSWPCGLPSMQSR